MEHFIQHGTYPEAAWSDHLERQEARTRADRILRGRGLNPPKAPKGKYIAGALVVAAIIGLLTMCSTADGGCGTTLNSLQTGVEAC
ncbi:hypothetical protein D3C74_468890 [compost metagenome]